MIIKAENHSFDAKVWCIGVEQVFDKSSKILKRFPYLLFTRKEKLVSGGNG